MLKLKQTQHARNGNAVCVCVGHTGKDYIRAGNGNCNGIYQVMSVPKCASMVLFTMEVSPRTDHTTLPLPLSIQLLTITTSRRRRRMKRIRT